MHLRRLTGLLLTLLTLHLNLLGADFACAKHGSSSGNSEQTASAHVMPMSADAASHVHAARHGQHASPTTPSATNDVSEFGNDQAPCDAPAQPACCKALTSCGVVFSAGQALDVASVLNDSELIAPSAVTAPPSERAAPEPPPPKA